MIVFDLLCSHGHRFESWFPSGASFERQQAAGAIECPRCSGHSVVKAPMAPRVASRSTQSGGEERDEAPESAPSGDAEAMRETLGRLRQHIEQNCE